MMRNRLVFLVLIALAVVGEYRWGWSFMGRFQENRACCLVPVLRNLSLSARELRGSAKFFSEVGQDKWVTETVFPDKTSGFFLDVGSGHGTIGSNTKLLELKGWTGICIDPFPKHMEGRTCTMLPEVVFSEGGKRVSFHASGDLGGIADTLGAWKAKAAQAPVVEFTTVTLADILERTHAPAAIDFMSLDIEGAELDALKGFPFDRYQVGAMAIEHNYEEPKRTDIETYLNARGYRRVHTVKQDDFYLPR
jgi:FkbM family methyltransferase